MEEKQYVDHIDRFIIVIIIIGVNQWKKSAKKYITEFFNHLFLVIVFDLLSIKYILAKRF
jgi:hypothetical protein